MTRTWWWEALADAFPYDGAHVQKGATLVGGGYRGCVGRDVCVIERSDFGRRRLAFDAARLRVRAAETREAWPGPSRIDRRLRADLTNWIDLASDTSTSLGLLWEWTRVAL